MLIDMSDFWAKHDSRNFKATVQVIALTKTWIVFSIFWKLIAINFLCCMYSVWKHLCVTSYVTFLHVNVHDCMYWMKTMMVHFDVLIIQLKKLNLCKLYFFLHYSVVLLCLRYPFYASEILGIRIEPLMWLRYTLWIPLYPLGVLFEGNLTPDN